MTQYENRLPSAIHPITPREQRALDSVPVETSAKRETRRAQSTDQVINGVSPGMTPTTDTNAVGHCQTEMDAIVTAPVRRQPAIAPFEQPGTGAPAHLALVGAVGIIPGA